MALLSQQAMPAGPASTKAQPLPPPPMAILAGTAVNQDGRSSALTAPNGIAQQVWGQTIRGQQGTCNVHLKMAGTSFPLRSMALGKNKESSYWS